MMHTVICAFDDRAHAQRAMERLIERGFSRDMIHLQGGYEGGASASSGASATTGSAEESHGFFHSVSQLFSELFGNNDSSGEAGQYTEAVRRGSTVLVVDAADEQEAESARDVMDEMGGTVGPDRRSGGRRDAGWRDGRRCADRSCCRRRHDDGRLHDERRLHERRHDRPRDDSEDQRPLE
jgi:hypothetical protein